MQERERVPEKFRPCLACERARLETEHWIAKRLIESFGWSRARAAQRAVVEYAKGARA